MASYDSDLQAAVDATSIAKASGETDLATYLRAQLADRDIETTDDAWVERMVQGIENDRNFMIDSEPSDYDSGS
ncbi:hypothetical protein [Nocardioides pantholopis]|uniref:hypothetical protein n=1 Tax=Nocardioides pantholopis TaxID=2483798 RepID=UPI000F094976|nr:hypothetical protein [Nocardioides pantholopis]